MLDVWTGKSRAPERTLFREWNSGRYEMLAAMHGDFKLLVMNGAHFLYNVVEDPGERRQLAAEYPDVLKRLDSELQAWVATEVKR